MLDSINSRPGTCPNNAILADYVIKACTWFWASNYLSTQPLILVRNTTANKSSHELLQMEALRFEPTSLRGVRAIEWHALTNSATMAGQIFELLTSNIVSSNLGKIVFDCCKQSLNWLYHPSIHPSTYPPTQHQTFLDKNLTSKLSTQLLKISILLTSDYIYNFNITFFTIWKNQNLIIIYKIDPH